MMSTKHKLSTIEKYGTYICLCSAAIAAIKGVKRY
jgi:hypothetical protein